MCSLSGTQENKTVLRQLAVSANSVLETVHLLCFLKEIITYKGRITVEQFYHLEVCFSPTRTYLKSLNSFHLSILQQNFSTYQEHFIPVFLCICYVFSLGVRNILNRLSESSESFYLNLCLLLDTLLSSLHTRFVEFSRGLIA